MKTWNAFRLESSLLLLLLAVIPARVDGQEITVTGRVEVFGPRNTKQANASGAAVWLINASETTEAAQHLARRRQELRLVQKDKSFRPHLLVVQVGSAVEFPNQDPCFHNVFSLFEGKRFDLGLYEAGTSHTVLFDRPGVCYIFCNIHPEMSAVVLVLNTPYFALSDDAGNVTISGVTPGRYILHVWHERAVPEDLKALSREITVSEKARSLGVARIVESPVMNMVHKNKYGQDYVPPSPANQPYSRP